MIAVYKKFFLMLGVTVLLCLSVSVVWSKEVATLYRSSVLGEEFRYHIATFDAKLKTKDGRFEYNWKNCLIARDLFQNQIGVEVKYWCEKGYVR